MKAVSASIALIGIAGFACACGGAAVTTSSPGTATHEVTKADLAVMPLGQAELGSEYASFPVDTGSGYLTSADIANNTTDPSDTAADIQNAGWVTSYGISQTDPSLKALTTGHGAFSISTEVDLFKDDQSAEAFLQKQLADDEKYKGQTLSAGIKLQNASQFGVTAGDQGFGLKEQDDLGGGTTGYGWIAGFRLGSLIASVQISRGDNNDMTSTMVQLVHSLETRVRGVLDGTVKDTPAPLPSATPINSP